MRSQREANRKSSVRVDSDTSEALRRAELAYLADTSIPLNSYPAFWAPFEIVGEGAAR